MITLPNLMANNLASHASLNLENPKKIPYLFLFDGLTNYNTSPIHPNKEKTSNALVLSGISENKIEEID